MPTEPLSAAYRRARAVLSAALPETNTSGLSLEARELSAKAAGVVRERFYFAQDAAVDPAVLDALLARRIAGEPLAYLLGEWDFCGRTFATDRRALIPRDDSMAVLELFLEMLPQASALTLLDLCTGTGCLGISAAAELAERGITAQTTLADLSHQALALAAENIERFQLGSRVSCQLADAFALRDLPEKAFDGCICNPPYIESAVVPTLDRSVNGFEPHMALDGGTDGLDFYRAIIADAPHILRPGGVLAFEVGYNQAEAVSALLAAAGYTDVQIRNDLQNVPRAVGAYSPKVENQREI